jgi:hypothetical protein
MPEDCGAYRSRHKSHSIDCECLKRAHPRIRVWEKQLREDEPRDDAVEEKVVPLDCGTNRRSDYGASQLYLMLGGGEMRSGDIAC